MYGMTAIRHVQYITKGLVRLKQLARSSDLSGHVFKPNADCSCSESPTNVILCSMNSLPWPHIDYTLQVGLPQQGGKAFVLAITVSNTWSRSQLIAVSSRFRSAKIGMSGHVSNHLT